METFTESYITAMLWSTTDDNDVPLDENFSIEDLAPETLSAIVRDCDRFQADHADLIEGREESAGHDFWLTRVGHGAGFWDGDWPAHGDFLTDVCKAYGEVWPYVGDDRLIYI